MRVPEKHVRLKNGTHAHLRSPEPADAAALLGYLRRLFADSWRNLNWTPARFERTTVEEETVYIRKMLEADGDFLLMACNETGNILGCISLGRESGDFSRHRCSIGMSVAAEARGQGLGKELLMHAVKAARDAGMWSMQLHVREPNKPAIALYEACGFRLVGRIEKAAFIEGEYVDEFLYQRIDESR